MGPWTLIEALGRVFGCFCLLGAYACGMMIIEIQIWDTDRYFDTDDTYDTDEIQTLGTFVFWGLDYACTDMMRYKIVFSCLTV